MQNDANFDLRSGAFPSNEGQTGPNPGQMENKYNDFHSIALQGVIRDQERRMQEQERRMQDMMAHFGQGNPVSKLDQDSTNGYSMHMDVSNGLKPLGSFEDLLYPRTSTGSSFVQGASNIHPLGPPNVIRNPSSAYPSPFQTPPILSPLTINPGIFSTASTPKTNPSIMTVSSSPSSSTVPTDFHPDTTVPKSTTKHEPETTSTITFNSTTFPGRFWFISDWNTWRKEQKRLENLRGGRGTDKNGRTLPFMIDGVPVNENIYGLLEGADGSILRPERHSSVLKLVHRVLTEMHEDRKLDPELVQRNITTENWREIEPRFDVDFPELRYCSASWKILHFFKIYMPTWKKSKASGKKRKSDETKQNIKRSKKSAEEETHIKVDDNDPTNMSLNPHFSEPSGDGLDLATSTTASFGLDDNGAGGSKTTVSDGSLKLPIDSSHSVGILRTSPASHAGSNTSATGVTGPQELSDIDTMKEPHSMSLDESRTPISNEKSKEVTTKMDIVSFTMANQDPTARGHNGPMMNDGVSVEAQRETRGEDTLSIAAHEAPSRTSEDSSSVTFNPEGAVNKETLSDQSALAVLPVDTPDSRGNINDSKTKATPSSSASSKNYQDIESSADPADMVERAGDLISPGGPSDGNIDPPTFSLHGDDVVTSDILPPSEVDILAYNDKPSDSLGLIGASYAGLTNAPGVKNYSSPSTPLAKSSKNELEIRTPEEDEAYDDAEFDQLDPSGSTVDVVPPEVHASVAASKEWSQQKLNEPAKPEKAPRMTTRFKAQNRYLEEGGHPSAFDKWWKNTYKAGDKVGREAYADGWKGAPKKPANKTKAKTPKTTE